MKNLALENYGVVEMNQKDITGIKGGYAWLWQAAVGTFVYNVIGDWNENVKAFHSGMNAAK